MDWYSPPPPRRRGTALLFLPRSLHNTGRPRSAYGPRPPASSRSGYKQDIMGLRPPIGIMHIVGSYQRDIKLLAYGKQRRIHRMLRRDTVILQFQEKFPLPKHSWYLSAAFWLLSMRPFWIFLATSPARQADRAIMPLMVTVQNLHIHTGFIVIALRKALCSQFSSDWHSRYCFPQAAPDGRTPVVPAGQLLIKTGIGRHIDLTAQDGLDSRFLLQPGRNQLRHTSLHGR